MSSAGESEVLPLEVVPGPPARQSGPVRSRAPKPPSDQPLARQDPIALVVVDTPLSHLDRPFEYLVPAELDETAQPGVRVKVRFGGRDRDGYLLARRAQAEHSGRLALLRKVVSAEPVLVPAVASAARSIADHYGGTLPDVLRLAIPPRHARAERSVPPRDEPAAAAVPGTPDSPLSESQRSAWEPYPAGAALLRRIRAGEAPAAAWRVLPGHGPAADWPRAIAEAVAAALSGGRGAVVVLPDHRDVLRLVPAVERQVDPAVIAQLTADVGPEARYRAFVRVLRGHARVVIGTRSAAWAPVQDPGLFVCWDDGDDLHAEPRAPYPHVRQILRRRATEQGAALLFGSFGRTVQVQAWVEEGTMADVVAPHEQMREQIPRVVVAGEGHQLDRDPAARSARIPSVAFRALREGLEHGPVLVQVPRRGYVVSLACADCRTALRCQACAGPIGLDSGAAGHSPRCGWCGAVSAAACAQCGSRRQRAGAVGASRTAEELGRAFPGTRIVSSGGEKVLAQVENEPGLVIATPGAEPWVAGDQGYRAVALLDGWAVLDRPGLDSAPEAFRRWACAAALAAPGAPVLLCGVPAHGGLAPVEALVRWDPLWLAARELAERRELLLPPVRRHVALTGNSAAVGDACAQLAAQGHRVLGEPLPIGQRGVRAIVREGGRSLAADVHSVQAGRTAKRNEAELRCVLDPGDDVL